MKLYRYIETFFYYRKLILLIVGILTSIFLYFSMRVTFDNSIEIWFLKDDESLQTYMGFLDRFGADEVIILAMLADNIFRPDMLATLDKVTRAVEEASPFIYRVRSLTNIRIAVNIDPNVSISIFEGILKFLPIRFLWYIIKPSFFRTYNPWVTNPLKALSVFWARWLSSKIGLAFSSFLFVIIAGMPFPLYHFVNHCHPDIFWSFYPLLVSFLSIPAVRLSTG